MSRLTSISLRRLVADFLAEHEKYRKYNDSNAAFGKCVDASHVLRSWLVNKGVKAKVTRVGNASFCVLGAHNNWLGLDPFCWTHYVVSIDNNRLFADLTFKQFDDRVKFPLIVAKSKMEKLWKEIIGNVW